MDERVNISEENVTALIEVKIAPQLGEGYDRIAERIYQYEEVESLYLMSGSYDLLVTITAKSLKAAAAFVYEHLAAIAGVTGTATSFVMKKYKEQNIILAPHPEQEERIDFI
ncbi:MAG: Lrp/AsnC ligand binding domain-containing protein [Oscillospiraceae bacterium]|nr:Lrp/AsnC ligand binding domain-containing protein [Oscillospiraceae bacterium]